MRICIEFEDSISKEEEKRFSEKLGKILREEFPEYDWSD